MTSPELNTVDLRQSIERDSAAYMRDEGITDPSKIKRLTYVLEGTEKVLFTVDAIQIVPNPRPIQHQGDHYMAVRDSVLFMLADPDTQQQLFLPKRDQRFYDTPEKYKNRIQNPDPRFKNPKINNSDAAIEHYLKLKGAAAKPVFELRRQK